MNHSKKNFFLLFLAAIALSACNNDRITLPGLLDEMVSYDESARYPSQPYAIGMESSHKKVNTIKDIPSTGNYEFTPNDKAYYLRLDTIAGRIEKVLFDQSGPGVITRFSASTPQKSGVLRFYFDNQTKPTWEIPSFDFSQIGIPKNGVLYRTHPETSKNGGYGSTLLLPIPYQERCLITYEEKNSTADIPRFYQINFRGYPKNTRIESLSASSLEKYSEKINQTEAILLNPPVCNGVTHVVEDEIIPHQWKDSISLHPEAEGKYFSFRYGIQAEKGGGCIRQLQIKVSTSNPDDYAQTMRGLILKIHFDEKKTVHVPLSDFSGGGALSAAVNSWYLQADGQGEITSRWVMPFQRNCEFEIVNESHAPAHVKLEIISDNWNWDERTLYFHTSWKQSRNLPLVADCNDREADTWNVGFIWGRGVYKGDLLSVYNHTHQWYGEGNEITFVNFVQEPPKQGVGIEDYYNTSSGPVAPFQTPFGGAISSDPENPHGYSTFLRTRNLDNIPFSGRFLLLFEMLGKEKGTIDCASTIYWYGDSEADIVGSNTIEEEANARLISAPEQTTAP